MSHLQSINATRLSVPHIFVGDQRPAGVLPARDRVAHCIASTETQRMVETALRMAGFDPVAVEVGDSVVSLRVLAHCSGVVHDLYPWDITGTLELERLRHRFPDLMIFLYAPARAGIAGLLSLCAHLTGVRAELQQGCTPRETERLRGLLASMMDDGPRLRLLRMIQAATPEAPAIVWRFTELALRTMGRGRLLVGDLASGLGISPRTLERAWRGAALPAPKELLEWLALLFAGLLSTQNGVSVASAARGLGIDSQQLYRFRHRLLPRALGPSRVEFETVFLAFAGRCRAALHAERQPI